MAGLLAAAGSGSDAADQGKRNRNVDLLSILQKNKSYEANKNFTVQFSGE